MKITKLAVSTIIATSLTLTAFPTNVDASTTVPLKISEKQAMSKYEFTKFIPRVKKEYQKIPVNIRAGFFINEDQKTVYVVIKNLSKNVKYKNIINNKYGNHNIKFINDNYSEEGLKKAKLSLEKFVNNNKLSVTGIGTNVFTNKVDVHIVKTEKETIEIIKNKYKSMAYNIEIVDKHIMPQPTNE